MSAARPTLRFLFSHPAHFIALGFGSGLAPFAPGTFGTLVAIPIAWSLWAVAGNAGFAIAIVATFAIGVWASAVTSRDLGVDDHGGIVIDEIVKQALKEGKTEPKYHSLTRPTRMEAEGVHRAISITSADHHHP